jgi:hypothetical protein
MLCSALFYVALIGVIATTFLSAGLAMTRATTHRLAQTYVAAGYQRAASSLQQVLATDLQNGPLPSPLPTFTPIPAACVDGSNPCRYQTGATITLTQTSAPANGSQCDTSQTNCASNEQANGYVDESRITARISVTVTAASDGSVLATRSGDVVVRTMNTPPYVVIAGTRDGAFDDVAANNSVGDDGGTIPATPNPCASVAPGTSDDTVVRVAYRNQTTNACTDGSSWRTQSYSSSGGAPNGWSR